MAKKVNYKELYYLELLKHEETKMEASRYLMRVAELQLLHAADKKKELELIIKKGA